MKPQSLFRPSYNIVRPLKISMAEAVEASDLSREQVVDKMNDLADRFGVRLTRGNGRRLTLETLEKWL